MKRNDIEILGGLTEVAKMCGVGKSTVCMWFAPKEKHGCGGRIPYKHAKVIANNSKFSLEYIMGDEECQSN